jgi:hypothetical protein
MEILVQDINLGLNIIDPVRASVSEGEGKGILCVRDIIELKTDPPQYKIYFEGINQPRIYWHGKKFECLPNQK